MDRPWQLILPSSACVIFRLPKACVNWLAVPLFIFLLIKKEATFYYYAIYGLIPQYTSFDVFPADHSCLLTEVAVILPVSWYCIWEYYSHELNLISCVAEKQRCQTVSVGVGTRPSESYVVRNSISQNFPPSVHVEAFFPQFVIHKICLNMNVEVLQICEENSRSYTVLTILYGIYYTIYGTLSFGCL